MKITTLSNWLENTNIKNKNGKIPFDFVHYIFLNWQSDDVYAPLTTLSQIYRCKQGFYVRCARVLFHPVGNELLSTTNKLFIGGLVPAMQALHNALVDASLDRQIKVSTHHSLGNLSSSSPPCSGKFRQGYDIHVLKPLLTFLQSTNSPFMVNPYPYFRFFPETLDYVLFRQNYCVLDGNSENLYTNMLNAQLDVFFQLWNLWALRTLRLL